ncbi:hypothetical protein [Lysinibacillus sp. G4S2]|uniref:hypothetical protein n=1 Tax=Lysinibacillus sp. G4S2 TaxID=3055859 RepID=UPI0025A0F3E3|nr:hypothetical protein [Lysinibacillus sp. G4S2]MDM5248173.1 hypothetical protein [Lysinibacillus sp. G4S2]
MGHKYIFIAKREKSTFLILLSRAFKFLIRYVPASFNFFRATNNIIGEITKQIYVGGGLGDMANWDEIKREWETTKITLAELAKSMR